MQASCGLNVSFPLPPSSRPSLFPRSSSTHFKRLGDDKAAQQLWTPPQESYAAHHPTFPPLRGTKACLLPPAPTAVFHEEKRTQPALLALWRYDILFLWPNLAADWKVQKSKKVDEVFTKSYLVRWGWFSASVKFWSCICFIFILQLFVQRL